MWNHRDATTHDRGDPSGVPPANIPRSTARKSLLGWFGLLHLVRARNTAPKADKVVLFFCPARTKKTSLEVRESQHPSLCPSPSNGWTGAMWSTPSSACPQLLAHDSTLLPRNHRLRDSDLRTPSASLADLSRSAARSSVPGLGGMLHTVGSREQSTQS